MEKESNTCLNCENDFEKGFQFCPHCGQKTKEDLTLGILFYNTISNYFSFDARLLKSLVPLMVKPGYLAKRFLEGKRLLYLHPAQMYLFISVVFFFLFAFISRNQVQNLDKVFKKDINTSLVLDSIPLNPTLDSLIINEGTKKINDNKAFTGIKDDELRTLDSIIETSGSNNLRSTLNFDFNQKKVDSLIAINAPDKDIIKAMGMNDDAGPFKRKFYAQMLKFYEERSGGSIFQAFLDSIPIAMLILLPIFALILKLLYYKKGPFSHHLVFSFYFFCFIFTVFSLVILLNFIWELPWGLVTVIVLSTFAYLFLALKRFYGQGNLLSLFKSGVASFLFLLVVTPLAIGIMGITAFLFY